MSELGWSDWVLVIGALVGGLLLTPLARIYSVRRGLIDQPGPRRSHHRPVARGGGIAIASSVLGVAAILAVGTPEIGWFAVGLAGYAMIGWIDDHRPLPVLGRLLPELALAGLLLWLLWPEAWSPWWLALMVLALNWWINLFNFMDGADGFAAGHGCFMAGMLGLGLLVGGSTSWAVLCLAIAAACAGFLCWNLPPARVFLGDVGSLMLGWALGFSAWVGVVEGSLEPAFWVILAAPFLVDASLTLAARVVRGRRWYTPHRDHAYQALLRNGWSHRRLLAALLAVDILLIAPIAGLALLWPELGSLIALVVLTALIGGWFVVQFWVAEGRWSE